MELGCEKILLEKTIIIECSLSSKIDKIYKGTCNILVITVVEYTI